MAEQQRKMSLSEALDIIKGNLDLLSSAEIKQAKAIINREGTPADKAYINKMDTHFVSRVLSDKKEDNALTVEQLNLIPDMIGNSSFSREDTLKALGKWQALAQDNLKDIVADKGENLDPAIFDEVVELAEKAFPDNADAKAKVVVTIERAKKIYDDENGLSNPEITPQVLEANFDAFETVQSELSASEEKAPELVEAETIFSNLSSFDEHGKPIEITSEMMDATWQEVRQDILTTPSFANASKEEQKKIVLDKFKATARASAFNLIMTSENEGNASEFAKEIQSQIKGGKNNAEIKSFVQNLSKSTLSSKLSSVLSKFEKVTSGVKLSKAEKVQVSHKSFMSNLASLSVKLDGFSARVGQKFGKIPFIKKYNDKITAWADRVEAKHPYFKWCRVGGKIVSKMVPTLAMSAAVLVTAGSGIGMPVAVVAAAYRFRRGTKRFLSDFNEKSKEAEGRGEKLNIRQYWKNASTQDKLKVGGALLATVGLGSFALLHVDDVVDTVSNVADASDNVSNTVEAAAHVTEVSETAGNAAPLIDSSIYHEIGTTGRHIQMAGGGVMGFIAGGMGYKQFKTWYNGLSAAEKKKFQKKAGIGGGIAAVVTLAAYAAYKVYDNHETSNINNLIDIMSNKDPKAPENIDFDRALHATAGMAVRNPKTFLDGIKLPEGIMPEGKTLADLSPEETVKIINNLDAEGQKALLFNIMKEYDVDTDEELVNLVLDNEIAGNPEQVNSLFDRLNALGELHPADGKEITQEVKNRLIKEFITNNEEVKLNYDGVDATVVMSKVNTLDDIASFADKMETIHIVGDNREDFNEYIKSWKDIAGEELSDQSIVEKMIEKGVKTLDELKEIILNEKISHLSKETDYSAYKAKLNLSDEDFKKAFTEHKLSSLDSIRDYSVNQSVNGIETEQLQSVLNSAHANGLVTDDMLPEVDEEKVAFADLTEEQQRDVLKAVINADNSNEDAIKDVADLQAHIKDLELDKALEGLDGKADIAKELGIEGNGEGGAVTDEDIKAYMNSHSLETTEALQAEAELHKEIGAIPAAEKDALAEHLGINKDELDEGTSLDDEIRSQMKAKEFDSVEELKADKALTDEFKTIDGDNNGLTTAYKDNLVELGCGDAEDGVTVDEVKDFMKSHDLNTKAELDAYIAQQTAPVTLTDEQVNLLGAAENGVKVELPQVDENGNPVLGEDGKPVVEDKTTDVKSALESLKNDGKYENITRHDLEEALKDKGFNDKQIEQISSQLNETKVAETPVDIKTPVQVSDLSEINGEWILDYHTPEGYDEARFENLNEVKGTSEEAVFRNKYLYRECFKDENGNPMNADQVIAKVKTLDGAGLLEGKPAEMNSQEYLYSRNMLRAQVGGITNGNLENYLAEAKITKEQWDSVLNGTASKETVDAIFKTNIGPHAARLLMDKDINCEMKLTVNQQAIVQRGIATLNWDKSDEFSHNKIGYYKGPGSVSYDENPYKVYNKNLNHTGMSIDCETQDVHGKGAYGPGGTSKDIETDVPTSTVPNNEVIELPLQQSGVSLTFGQNNITEFQATTVGKSSAPVFYYNQQVSNTSATPLKLFMPGEERSGSEYLYVDEKNRLYKYYSEGSRQAEPMRVGSVKLDDAGNIVKVKSAAVIMKAGEEASVPVTPYAPSTEVIHAEVAKLRTIEGIIQEKNGLLHYTVGDTSRYFMPTKQGLVEMHVNEKTGNVSSVIRTYESHNTAPNLPKETQEALYKEAQEKLKAIHTAGVNAADAANYQQTLLDVVGSKDWPDYEIHGVKGSEMLVMKAEHGVITVNGGKMEYLHDGSIGEATHQADLAKAQKALETYNKAEMMSKTATHQLDNTATRRLGLDGRFNLNNAFNKGTSR